MTIHDVLLIIEGMTEKPPKILIEQILEPYKIWNNEYDFDNELWEGWWLYPSLPFLDGYGIRCLDSIIKLSDLSILKGKVNDFVDGYPSVIFYDADTQIYEDSLSRFYGIQGDFKVRKTIDEHREKVLSFLCSQSSNYIISLKMRY